MDRKGSGRGKTLDRIKTLFILHGTIVERKKKKFRVRLLQRGSHPTILRGGEVKTKKRWPDSLKFSGVDWFEWNIDLV